MIQFILMLLGLAFPNNNTHTTDNNQTHNTVVTYSAPDQSMNDGGPVGGETEQTPPPKR